MFVFLTRENKAKRVRNYGDRHRAPISDVTFPSTPRNLLLPLLPPPPSSAPTSPLRIPSHVVTIVPRDFSRSRFPIARKDCTCLVSLSFYLLFSFSLSLWSRKCPVEQRVNPLLKLTMREKGGRKWQETEETAGIFSTNLMAIFMRYLVSREKKKTCWRRGRIAKDGGFCPQRNC